MKKLLLFNCLIFMFSCGRSDNNEPANLVNLRDPITTRQAEFVRAQAVCLSLKSKEQNFLQNLDGQTIQFDYIDQPCPITQGEAIQRSGQNLDFKLEVERSKADFRYQDNRRSYRDGRVFSGGVITTSQGDLSSACEAALEDRPIEPIDLSNDRFMQFSFNNVAQDSTVMRVNIQLVEKEEGDKYRIFEQQELIIYKNTPAVDKNMQGLVKLRTREKFCPTTTRLDDVLMATNKFNVN